MINKILIFSVIMILISQISGIPCLYCDNLLQGAFEYSSKGKRDPFVPLVGQEKPKIAGLSDTVSIEDIRIEGIALGAGGKNIAILNGQVVKDNDKFGVISIKKISQKSVELSIEDKDYILKLQEPLEGK